MHKLGSIRNMTVQGMARVAGLGMLREMQAGGKGREGREQPGAGAC